MSRSILGVTSLGALSGAAVLKKLVLLPVLLMSAAHAGAQDLDAGRRALQAGQYAEAISVFERLSAGSAASGDAMRLLLRTYGEVGRYDDAERAAARFSATPTGALAVSNSLGEILHARGRLDQAEAAFREAAEKHAADSLRARLNLAILAFDRGERESAMTQFDHFIDVYNRGQRLTSEELTAVAIACRYLGLDTPVLFKDALKAFDQAIAADSLNMEPRVKVAELFLEKYNSADAQAAFDDVLARNERHPRALLGVAQRRIFDSHPGSDTLIAQALAVNPAMVDAFVLRAKSSAPSEKYDDAITHANSALAVDPTYPPALSVLAAIHYLKGDSAAHQAAVAKTLARNPRYADLYVTLAGLAGRNRFYRQAAEFASKGVALDPRSYASLTELGINQMRTGEIEAARRNLDAAFAGDPYNALVKNTLDLMDTFTQYDVVDNGKFRLMIGKSESALLGLYATDLLQRAYDSLSARYGYDPEPPIRVEFYRRHADFSVRTVGLAGIGALGVSFGTVLAMDSPTGRETGPFNWGAVLWHELAHTFTLGVTNNRVPRWLSEGLSVYEERKSGIPGWGSDPDLDFLRAYKANMLVKVSSMNDGFMRPVYPEQLLHSYYQASLVCEMIEAQHGARALKAMLDGYRAGQTTEQVFRSALNMTPAQMDAKFDEYLRTRFKVALEAVGQAGIMSRDRAAPPLQLPDSGEYVKAMVAGTAAEEAGNANEAMKQYQRAASLFPEFAPERSPYLLMASLLLERDDAKGAAEQLARHNSINENSHETHLAEAGLRERIGDLAGAVKVLDRSMYIYPYDMKSHEKLAELASKVGEKQIAVRERRAIIALKPVDLAEAYYQLALALHDAGDNTAARREVLKSLEEAPNYSKAQDLLLKLRGGGVPLREEVK